MDAADALRTMNQRFIIVFFFHLNSAHLIAFSFFFFIEKISVRIVEIQWNFVNLLESLFVIVLFFFVSLFVRDKSRGNVDVPFGSHNVFISEISRCIDRKSTFEYSFDS